LTEDGKPYGPYRYAQIVKECYLISKNCNTSYTDLMDITPYERKIILNLIADEIEKSQAAIEKSKQEAQARSKSRRK